VKKGDRIVKTVFFDVDTQLDFLYPSGALYVPGAEQIVPALASLTRFAASKRLQIISTADAHTEDDPEFKVWKPHCVAATLGQRKAGATQLPGATVVSTANDRLEAAQVIIEQIILEPIIVQQIIIEKQKLDPFSNPKLRPLLEAIRANRYVVYGVVTELCVRYAALGLLETGARVELVTDATKSLNLDDELAFIGHFQAQGGHLTTAAQILSG
jgi:nicotinamidase/pyrazinamidase